MAQAQGRGTNVPVWFDLLGYPEFEAGLAPDNAVELFEQAYSQTLSHLRDVAPNASIYCISLLPGRMAVHDKPDFCYSLRGKTLDEYNDAIARAARSQNCEFVDIRAFAYDYSSSDGTHPDAIGMQQLAAMVVAGIEGLESLEELDPAQFDVASLFPDRMRSDRLCFKSNCIGCEYATSTGNKWSLVCNLPA